LEKEATSPYHLPASLVFIDPGLPTYSIFEIIFKKAFYKAYSVAYPGSPYSNPNNHCGYALSGQKGVGKSTIMRVCTIVLGLLLHKNLISAYVNYTYFKTPPLGLIQKVASLNCLILKNRENRLDHTLAELRQQKVIVALFCDEIRNIYTSKHLIWQQFHDIATDHYGCLSVADSAFLASTLVKGTNKTKIKALGLEPQATLNPTKLSTLQVLPLSTIYQYMILLKRLYPNFVNQFLLEEEHKWKEKKHFASRTSTQEKIQALHMLSSGTYRNIARFVAVGLDFKNAKFPLIPSYKGIKLFIYS
jgi:hypothetical protein